VQGVLTDAQSKRILQDTIAPHFRQNDYYGGLVAGVGAISALLDQEKFPAPKAQARQPTTAQDDASGPGVIMSIFLIVIGIIIVRSIFRRRSPYITRVGPGGWHSGLNSGMTGFILGNAIANAEADEARRRGGGFDGGFSGGGFSGGDSGGFSGGGGSFDGGGASGDW